MIPFGPKGLTIFGQATPTGITNLNIGLLILFAITSMGVYGVALAGWSSNSKYPLLGGLRSSAQMISYELAMTMSVVGVILMAGTFNLSEIVTSQQGFHWGFLPRWNLIGSPMPQVLGFCVVYRLAIAETNRAPFDLAEAESELVAGFHTEYSSFKFAMFFMAEYASMITVSCLATILLFGGWLSPFPQTSFFQLDALHSGRGLRDRRTRLDRARCPLYHRVWADRIAGSWSCPVRPRGILRPAGRHRIYSGAVLVPVEDRNLSFYLRLGARHASAFPIRPVDEFRVEGVVAAFDRKRGDHKSFDCADTTMSSSVANDKNDARSTTRGTR